MDKLVCLDLLVVVAVVVAVIVHVSVHHGIVPRTYRHCIPALLYSPLHSHVHHLLVHVVSVVHAVGRHGAHGAQRRPAQEPGCHAHTQRLDINRVLTVSFGAARYLFGVPLAVLPCSSSKVGAPAGAITLQQ